MLLLELLSRLHNSNTSLLFWNLFNGLFSERIEYKIISLTLKILNTTQPSYLYDLVSIQPPHSHNKHSSPYVTLIKPSSSLKVTRRSFRHASPHLWTQLPTSLWIHHPNYSLPSQRPSIEHAGLSCYTLLEQTGLTHQWWLELPAWFTAWAGSRVWTCLHVHLKQQP